MIVQMRPRVSFGFPSTMSSQRMFTSLIWNISFNISILLLQVGIKGCPFQLIRSYKKHEENKSKIGQERSSMQQADYQCHRPTPWMQESVSMHKIPTPVRHSRMNQARSEEEEKERQRPVLFLLVLVWELNSRIYSYIYQNNFLY